MTRQTEHDAFLVVTLQASGSVVKEEHRTKTNMNNNEITNPQCGSRYPLFHHCPLNHDGFYRMRGVATACFTALKDNRTGSSKPPTAAGKSFEICALGADCAHPRQKPDAHHRRTPDIMPPAFESNKIEFPDGTRVKWAVKAGHIFAEKR